MNYKRASKSAFSKLACFIRTSSSSSSTRGVSASTNALVVDGADHQNPKKKPGVTGFFNNPENVVEDGKYNVSQNEAIVDEHSNDSTILGNDGHAMLVDGEEKSQSVQQCEVSSGEAEALPLNPDDLAMPSNSMQQSDGSSLEFEAALLNPDDLSYLGLNDGSGPMGTSPISTISNNFDCY